MLMANEISNHNKKKNTLKNPKTHKKTPLLKANLKTHRKKVKVKYSILKQFII